MENAGAAVARAIAERYPRARRVGRGLRARQQRRRRLRRRAAARGRGRRSILLGRAGAACRATRSCTCARFERSGGRLLGVARRGRLGGGPARASRGRPARRRGARHGPARRADGAARAGRGRRCSSASRPACRWSPSTCRPGCRRTAAVCDWPSARADADRDLRGAEALPRAAAGLRAAAASWWSATSASPRGARRVGADAVPARGRRRGGRLPAGAAWRAQGRLRPRADRGRLGRQDRAPRCSPPAARCAPGAGLVTVATPEPCAAAGGAGAARGDDGAASGDAGRRAVRRRARAAAGPGAATRDAVVLGPGLGQDPETRALVQAFVRACPVPLVLDADGLNALAPAPGRPRALAALRRDAPTVLTPHPGEMARLVGRSDRARCRPRRPEIAGVLAARDGRRRRAQGRAHAGRGARRARRGLRRPATPAWRRRARATSWRASTGALLARHGGAARGDRRGRRARPRRRPRGGPRRPGGHDRGRRGRGAAGGDRVACAGSRRWRIRELTQPRRGRDGGAGRALGGGLPRRGGRAADGRAGRGQDRVRARAWRAGWAPTRTRSRARPSCC